MLLHDCFAFCTIEFYKAVCNPYVWVRVRLDLTCMACVNQWESHILIHKRENTPIPPPPPVCEATHYLCHTEIVYLPFCCWKESDDMRVALPSPWRKDSLCYEFFVLAGISDRYIADESYRYKANFSNGSVCLTFSLEANIFVSYRYINYSNSSHPISVMVRKCGLITVESLSA